MRRAGLVVLALIALVACSREATRSAATAAPSGAAPTSSSEASTGPEDPAKSAFVRAANAACRDYAKKDEALDGPAELDDFVPFLKEFIRIGDELQARLRALPVPPDDAKGIEGYLGGNDEQARVLKEALRKIESAVRDNDLDAAEETLDEAIDEFNRISTSQDPFAWNYGLTGCANPNDEVRSSVEA